MVVSIQTAQFRKLYQNESFLVISKPESLNFHCQTDSLGDIEKGIVVLVKEQFELDECYPVHRLDKMTSGILLFALNKAAAQIFQQLFEQHAIEKYYLALSDKKPKKKQGWVLGDMAPARRGSWKLLPSKHNPAKTQFLSFSVSPGLRLYLLKPYTGKTHQLRVAMKSIGVPIIGDVRYGDAVNAKQFDRGYLHAFAIRFVFNGQPYSFVDMPHEGSLFLTEQIIPLLAKLSEPWLAFES